MAPDLAPALEHTPGAHDLTPGGEPSLTLFERSLKQGVTTELVCQHLFRPIAHLVVLVLLPFRVPPPAVVLAAGAAGLAAAVELARGHLIAAALLLVLKTVLDNADGQLARASGRVSALGRHLDSESDLLVNAALFAALGYRAGRPLVAAAAFLVLTLVLSVNFNLRRLYLSERGEAAEAMAPAEGAGAVLRRVYGVVYAPQDRAVESFVRWRLRRLRAGAVARLAYHDRATIGVLHNLGLSGQMTAFALCLALGRPHVYVWLVFACGFALLPLELRRELEALGRGRSAPAPWVSELNAVRAAPLGAEGP
jgi:archaetidylinositol phosphate synthase